MSSLYESSDANVSHPKHYQSRGGLEVIDAIEAFTEDLDGIEAVDTANIIKYACRWKKKNGRQDVEKIIWYATHLLNRLDKKPTEVNIQQFSSKKDNIEEKRSQTIDKIKFLEDLNG